MLSTVQLFIARCKEIDNLVSTASVIFTASMGEGRLLSDIFVPILLKRRIYKLLRF